MPTNTNKAKARVMYAEAYDLIHGNDDNMVLHDCTLWGKKNPVSVIPHRTKSEAKALCRWANKSAHDREHQLACLLLDRSLGRPINTIWKAGETARAILQLTGGKAK